MGGGTFAYLSPLHTQTKLGRLSPSHVAEVDVVDVVDLPGAGVQRRFPLVNACTRWNTRHEGMR